MTCCACGTLQPSRLELLVFIHQMSMWMSKWADKMSFKDSGGKKVSEISPFRTTLSRSSEMEMRPFIGFQSGVFDSKHIRRRR